MIKRLVSLLVATTALTGLAHVAHAQASPSPFTSATRYDNAGRATGTISPNDAPRGYPDYIATRTTYDSAGRPIKVENGHLSSWQSEAVAPASWAGFSVQTSVETTYNAQNQKLTERVKGTDLSTYSLTQYSYDSSGRLECKAVRMNPAVYGSLPASACTLGTQGSDGPDRITRNYYDAAGQLVQVREGVGAGSTIEAAEVTYSYTNNGKIQHVVDAGGHKALMCYDGYDRKTRWVFPSTTNPGSFNDATAALALSTAGAVNGGCTGTSGDYEEYGYDTNGNRTSLRKRDGQTLTYQYDFLNRNTVKFVPGSTTHTRDVYYSYDLRGLMTSARFDSTAEKASSLAMTGSAGRPQRR
jgi:YD repeat-containing protein